MSAPRLISPLLDNFVMGEPIFDRGGVRILPAMEQGKEEKYIVKIISIPANQSQVDALLITGAYKDADAVNGYFSELADGVIREAEILNQLSNAGGFDGFTNMQVVPMDDGNGFDVYLLAPYRSSWARLCQQKQVTQLDGYNLALDICASLSVARRNGYIFANLKPESISVSPTGSYHINDLGLIGLDYLQYSSLPTGYFSAYTAPEVADAYSSLNSTMDVYALGMVLYEIFNGGLPFEGERATITEYPAPAYADEEFAQIILKAVHPDPSARWQDPTEMGQAIVSVMQRKGVSDAPILPPVEIAVEETEETPVIAEDIVEAIAEDAVKEESEAAEVEIAEAAPDENKAEEEGIPEIPAEETEPVASEVVETVIEQTDAADETPVIAAESAETAEEILPTEDIPSTEEPELTEEDVTEDAEEEVLDDILSEADKLIADLQLDTDTITGTEEYEQLTIEETAEETESTTTALPVDPDESESAPVRKKSGKGKVIIGAILLVILLIGGLFFYRHVYMQEIDVLSVTGSADKVEISVITTVDSSKLSVICTDANGNTYTARLDGYKATISGLAADTSYAVKLKMDGFHKLFGQTEYAYSTPEVTVIKDFTVLNGLEEGTAEVSYSLSGPSDGNWSVIFQTQGEEPCVANANNGKASVAGLTAGKTYTVTLSSTAALYFDEEVQLTFTPGPVVKPVNAYVQSCTNGKLTVKWSSDVAANWIVRCYNDEGFDETVTVSETTAIFNVSDTAKAYNIEIAAQGQSAVETLHVTANAITLNDFTVDTSLPGTIKLNWTASADVPEGGYVATYTVDGVEVETTIKVSGNSLVMDCAVPGAVHVFTFATANGQSVLCAPVTATATGGKPFSGYGITSSVLRFNFCARPTKANWGYNDVSASAYTTTFSVGQKAGVVGRIISRYYTADDMVTILYVFRDTNNAIIHTCFIEQNWGDMWYNGYGAFDIPSLPDLTGSYKLDMFFDGGLVNSTSITIK